MPFTLSAQPFDTLRRADPGGWEFIQVHGNGTIINEASRHNGIPEGVWVSYWQTGLPHYITTYKAGIKDGLVMETDKEGFTTLIDNYRNGKLEGPRRVYARNAFITEEACYAAASRKKAVTTILSAMAGPPGIIKMAGRLPDTHTTTAVVDGDVTFYTKGGKVAESGSYKGNKQTGRWKEYYPDGKPKREGSYLYGEKDGPWKQWDESGKPIKPVTYKKGEAK